MRRAKWSTVVIALGVIAALAIATPSIGGSLKKLVKKEVSKQIKKAQGPQGPAGPDGNAKAGARIVGADASISPGTAFGGIETSKSAAGGYCIRVPFTPKNIVASVHESTHYARVRLLAFGGGFGTCAGSLPGYNAWVTTHLLTTQAFSDSDFYVLVN